LQSAKARDYIRNEQNEKKNVVDIQLKKKTEKKAKIKQKSTKPYAS